MIYKYGNLLDDQSEALVNTVNEVGIMGKGIALMFKKRFPANFKKYQDACDKKEVAVGKMFVTKESQWIINFPTKKHWKNSSKIEWIKEGLVDLVSVIQENKIQSIAMPPLGCGNGGLHWEEVHDIIKKSLSQLSDVRVTIYENH